MSGRKKKGVRKVDQSKVRSKKDSDMSIHMKRKMLDINLDRIEEEMPKEKPKYTHKDILDPKKTKKMLDRKAGSRIMRIVWLLVLFLGVSLLMLYFAIDLGNATGAAQNAFFQYLPSIVTVCFIIVATTLILWIAKPLFDLLVKYRVKSHGETKVMYQLFAAVIWVISIIIMFYAISGNIQDIGIGITVMSAALVFVLGKPVFNVFAWLIIIFRKPFVLGDRVSVDYGEFKVEGDVVDISLFYTFIRESGAWLKGEELSGRMVTIPNSVLLDKPLFNFTKADPHIWDRITVTITFESDHKKAKKIMLEAANWNMRKFGCDNVERFNKHLELKDLRTHVLDGPEIEFEITKNGILLELLYMVHSRERGLLSSAISEYILDEFSKEESIQFAYPHIQLANGKRGAKA